MSFVRLPIERDGLHCIPLYEEVAVAVAGSEHYLAAAEEVTHADIADDEVDWSAISAKDAVAVVANGDGVAVMPMSLARLHHRKDAIYRPVTDLSPTTVGLAWLVENEDPRVQIVHRDRAGPDRAVHADLSHQDVASGRPSANPAADWTPTTARSWNSVEVVRAGVGAGRADPGADLVDEVLDAGPRRVEEHPRGGDALLVEPLAGPVERRRRSPYGWPPRAPRPSRSSPCTPGRRRPTCRSPGDSWVPANHEPIITCEAPAASASATSRGCRTPPSAQTCLPSSRAASAHSSTALNCGRPTPVIIRVVHIAPGPTPTLTMSAPASTRSWTPSAETTLPATTGTSGSTRPHRGERLEHPLLVPVRGVDDQAVDARRRAARCALPATSPLTPIAAAIRRPPVASTAGW